MREGKKNKKKTHQQALKLDWLRLPHLSDTPEGFNGPPGASRADGRVTFTDTGEKRERRKGRVMLLLLKMTSEASFAYRCQDSAALQPDWLPVCVCVCEIHFSTLLSEKDFILYLPLVVTQRSCSF